MLKATKMRYVPGRVVELRCVGENFWCIRLHKRGEVPVVQQRQKGFTIYLPSSTTTHVVVEPLLACVCYTKRKRAWVCFVEEQKIVEVNYELSPTHAVRKAQEELWGGRRED